VQSSHSLDRLHTTFDEPHLIAHAGLLLPATLAQHLRLPQLFTDHVDLGQSAGQAHVGRKAMTMIASLLAGGDCIDDASALRAAGSAVVLGHAIPAPSTLGTFLRAFSWGHAKQLDVVSGLALQRAWAAGAGPGDRPVTIDLDSTICETYGLHKQGGSRFTYHHVRGYHPLLATRAGAGEVLHGRLRGGPSNSGRGASQFLAETLVRVRRAGARGPLVVRADSGFCHQKVVATCRRYGARFSITVRLTRNLWKVIGEVPEPAWTPIPYWLEGAADVAEVSYVPFATRRRRGQPAAIPVRLIVRRVQPTPGSQLHLQGVLYSYHAFITDRDGPTLELEADHRRHAVVENTIRELKEGVGLNHLPSGRFGANAAWLAFTGLAHNLARWVARLGLGDERITTARLRRQLFVVPARLVRSGRQVRLRFPQQWPWQDLFGRALLQLRALTIPLPLLI
jgi:Transposase DDE domain group 1